MGEGSRCARGGAFLLGIFMQVLGGQRGTLELSLLSEIRLVHEARLCGCMLVRGCVCMVGGFR